MMLDQNKLSRPTDDQAKSALDTYLEDVSRHEVMTREEELELATRIAESRRGYWKALLSYPPYVEPITQLIGKQLPEVELPPGLLENGRRAARAFRDRQTRKNRDQYTNTVEAIAAVMMHQDPDNLAADMAAADLELLDAGCIDGLNMDVRQPPRGSAPFRAYVQRVRASATALRAARNRFVRANLRLVLTMAHRYNHGLLALPDLIQEGNLGLLKAVDRFDHRRGYRFSTYATWWIRHAISRATANRGRTVRVPAHMTGQFHQLKKARRKLESQLGRTPSSTEIAEELQVPEEKVDRIQEALRGRPISLDAPLHDEDGRTMIEVLPDADADTVGQQLEAEDEREILHRALEVLSPIEVDIVRKRFGLEENGREYTLKEVGQEHSLSRERIRQLQERAIQKIREELERQSL